MNIKERKLRMVGNSIVISVSKDFLAENHLQVGDAILLDEDKLKEAITKKNTHDAQLDFLINQSLQEYNDTYKDLVDL
ncbi:addiction module antitoxin [Enterococcus devriesei]|nr:addiction module antitoxin [Enterococcus devriesei]MBU5365518.1 addiction module antitoxin [Enterococcus devriesei]MDU6523288.1 addiction module antitoxin [Enterococcus sp.]